MLNEIDLNELNIDIFEDGCQESFEEIKEVSFKDIAIIGISARLPFSGDIDAFWEGIKSGTDFIGDLPDTRRKDIEDYFIQKGMDIESLKFLKGAYMEDIDKFDCNFFRLSPEEANLMNPNQRLFLQTAWEAIEDAGYGGKKVKGSKTGVYVGYIGDLEGFKYSQMISETSETGSGISMSGNLASIIPSRISYLLDLKGPSMLVDTACSSSLVAVHLACQGIRNGDCDLALAGGIRVNLIPVENKEKIGMESSDGRARSFDDSSDGTGIGEGVITVMLKPLCKAVGDGDHIYAVIKGSAVNQDGSSIGITAPNVEAQTDVITKAWLDANIDPESITYIEAHGTGTKLGDPVEIEGIQNAFERFTDKKQFCAIGSVKTNIGHLYEASGIAGLLKAVLALKNRQLPPLNHFNMPNRRIDFEKSPVYVNDRLSRWETDGYPLRCGVSAFGFSGTNCHVVLEEAPQTGEISCKKNVGVEILTLSAKTEKSLKELLNKYKVFLENGMDSNFEDICFTANTGREHYKYRLAMAADTWDRCRNIIENIIQKGFPSMENSVEGVYFGVHRIVADEQDVVNAESLTEEKKLLYSKIATEKIKEYQETKDEDKLHEICRLYVSGANVDWEGLYRDRKLKKASIPTYAFENRRCWIRFSGSRPEKVNEQESEILYSLRWKQEEKKQNGVRKITCPVVVIKDENGLGGEITDKLRNAGIKVLEVKFGCEFKKVADLEFVINGIEEDYRKLSAQLGECDTLDVIHISTVGRGGTNDIVGLEESQRIGLYSLFYLVKALTEAGGKKEINITLVSDYVSGVTGQEERINPENATMFGLSKVVNIEYPGVKCRCIDIDRFTGADDILYEFYAHGKLCNTAYRNGNRYVQEFGPADIKNFQPKMFNLNGQGVYVVTGGTGGIGLEIAKFMASKGKLNLALLNRTKMPERIYWEEILAKQEDLRLYKKINVLKEIELSGSVIECIACDISKAEELDRTLKGLREKYGRINGIVHSAGIAGNGLIRTRPDNEFNDTLLPKVYGTWNLDKLTIEDKLEFFIMFSSGLTLTGEYGQGDYTAANSFLDSFSDYRNKRCKGTMTINWVAWKDTGMASDYGFQGNSAFRPLPTDKAIAAFEKVLGTDIDRVFIGEMDYTRDLRVLLTENLPFRLTDTLKKKLSGYANPLKQKACTGKANDTEKVALTGKDHEMYSDAERVIGQVVSEVLGFKEINVYDSFFELGADSILLSKVQTKLSECFPGRLTVADLFAYPSISKLARFISGSSQDNFGKEEKMESGVEKDIAITGISIKFPGADSIEEYWENIRGGKDCIGKYPDVRVPDAKQFMSFLNLGEMNAEFAEGGYLAEVDKFDYAFFRLSPKEASYMDPNQRLFLQTVWSALEDAGYCNKALAGSKTGVYVGFSKGTFDYDRLISEGDPFMVSNFIVGNLPSIIPGRVAFLLDLKGPTVVVDTACSSSLVAVHMACRGIRNGECDIAIAGGVKINLLPLQKRGQAGIGIESTDGRARTFDEQSDGTGWGEGTAAIILKPLKKAIEDRDNIYAVIKGSAVNQDGNSIGITAPNSISQADAIVDAWKDAGVQPETITYIEAHGTGTKLGDPVEIDGIRRAFKRFTDRKQFCAIGSAKTNVGHMDTLSGLAGLIKAVLAMKHREIPPSLNFNRPNKKIAFEDSPVFVNDRLIRWETEGFPVRCGVSSFGFSGTNCHVVLEEPPEINCSGKTQNDGLNVFTLSAKSENSLKESILKYKERISKYVGLDTDDLCYTLNTGREHYNYRLALIVKNRESLNYFFRNMDSDDLKHGENGFYYGSFRVVDHDKKVKDSGEISSQYKKEISTRASGLLAEFIAGGKKDQQLLDKLCELYVQGADVEWEDLYRDGNPHKVSLPVYQFNKSRCWVDKRSENKENTGKEKIHDLVGKCAVESFGQEIYVTRLCADEMWILRDHRIMGKHVLPGTAYLEMAREAAKKHYGESPIELRDVIFSYPVVLNEGEYKDIHIIIKKAKGHLEFTAASKVENEAEAADEWQVHAEAMIFKIEAQKQACCDMEEAEVHGGSSIQNINQNDLTRGFIEFGPRWINYHSLRSFGNVSVAGITLPDQFKSDLNGYYLHPAMMDMAVNAVSLTLGERYLPLSYRSIKIYGPTPARFLSRIVKNLEEIKALKETITFDVDLMDECGQVFARIEGYSIKRLYDAGNILKSKNNYFNIRWIQEELEEELQDVIEGTVLVFKDLTGLGDGIIRELRASGTKVIEVEHGATFFCSSSDRYTVDCNVESYEKLLKSIAPGNLKKILHLSSVENDADAGSIGLLNDRLNRGVYSLFNLIKGIVKNRIKDDVDILIVTNYANAVTGSEKIIYPHNSSLFGLSGVISKEHINLNCRCIDIDDTIQQGQIISQMKSFVKNGREAYREGIRYVQELNTANLNDFTERKVDFKEYGIYVVTGGTGGIGLEICKSITSKAKVNLALINRSVFPDKDKWDEILSEGGNDRICGAIKAIKEINGKGSEVVCCSADISETDKLKLVLDGLRRKYGRINGVIHSAGVAGDGFIYKKDKETFHEVLLPKIHGTLNLDNLTREDNPDFFIMFSSVASLFDIPGQGDYIAANSYMDSFAAYRNNTSGRTLTINWPAWKETGMAFLHGANVDTVFNAIFTVQAVDAFDSVINRDITRVIIGDLNYGFLNAMGKPPIRLSKGIEKNLEKYGEKLNDRNMENKLKDVFIKGNADKTYSDIEIRLSKIWAQILGLEEINIYESFHEMGGDSIMATRLLREIEKEYPGVLDITDVFSYSSISKMADFIGKKLKPKTGDLEEKETVPEEKDKEDNLEDILTRLADGEISVDQVDDLLSMGGKE